MDYYQDDSGTQVAKLPFKRDSVLGGHYLNFYMILPPANGNAKALVANHVANRLFWSGVDNQMRSRKVYLELPKFKFNTDKKFNKNLTRLGMGEIFDEDFANFSHLSEVSIIYFLRQARWFYPK